MWGGRLSDLGCGGHPDSHRCSQYVDTPSELSLRQSHVPYLADSQFCFPFRFFRWTLFRTRYSVLRPLAVDD